MAIRAEKSDCLGERMSESWMAEGLLLLLKLSDKPLRSRLLLLWSTCRWIAAGADFFLLGGIFGAKEELGECSMSASRLSGEGGGLSLLFLL